MRRDGKKICSLLAVLAFGLLLAAGAAQPEREIAGVGDKAQNAKTEENRDAVSDADQGNRLLDSFQIEVDRNRFQIACVGDSITAGAGVEETGELPYPDILQELAGEKVQVHNFGVKGRSLLSTSRWPYREEGVLSDESGGVRGSLYSDAGEQRYLAGELGRRDLPA